jgi:hypothetical protein
VVLKNFTVPVDIDASRSGVAARDSARSLKLPMEKTGSGAREGDTADGPQSEFDRWNMRPRALFRKGCVRSGRQAP